MNVPHLDCDYRKCHGLYELSTDTTALLCSNAGDRLAFVELPYFSCLVCGRGRSVIRMTSHLDLESERSRIDVATSLSVYKARVMTIPPSVNAHMLHRLLASIVLLSKVADTNYIFIPIEER